MPKIVWDHYIKDQQRWSTRLQTLALEATDAEGTRLTQLAVKAYLNARDVNWPATRRGTA